MVQNRGSNPLAAFMRQPKVYITLPSNGEFYPEGSIEMPENGQLAVYSMTAKDELMLNIPDALMNGQAVVDIIQNCIPQIKNAWHVPSIDMDILLLAIRLATYGEIMKTPVVLKEGHEFEYQVDIRNVMDNLLNNITWDSIIPIDQDMTIYVKPLNYSQMSKTAVTTFETQKIMQAVNDEQLTDEQKVEIFKNSFTKLSDVTMGVIAESIFKVETSAGIVDDKEYIKDFVLNCDKEIFNKIQKHLEQLQQINSIKPIEINVTDEMRNQGITDDKITIPLTFDPSNFFASGF